jgi:site-specific DNA-methyltransferase (adenine-specific)
VNKLGRFPANLIHDNSEEVRECFPETKSGKAVVGTGKGYAENASGIASTGIIASCFADSGNASRFFKSIIYQAKASKSERNKGCEGLEEKVRVRQGLAGEHKDTVSSNSHPTVKPVALMEYLIKMVTPTNGIVLDPFMGSGSTGVACVLNDFEFVGIDLDKDYCEIARARIEGVKETQTKMF